MIQTICRCTLCNTSYADSDIDRMVFGLKTVDGGQLAFARCCETDKHICILCVGQIKAVSVDHWVLSGKAVDPCR
jgi:hypothetical protein